MTEYFSLEWAALSVRLCVFLSQPFLSLFSTCQGGNTYVSVSNLPTRRQPHSVFRATATAFYLNTIQPILMKLWPHDLIKNLRWHFSQILKMSLWWCYGSPFVCFWMRHSHDRNFALIFFKIIDRKIWYLPMLIIKNQKNQLITSSRKSRTRFKKLLFWYSGQFQISLVQSPAGAKVFGTWIFVFVTLNDSYYMKKV